MEYKMIAFDVDGTLLNSKKQMTPGVSAAIAKAVERGKKVILLTGRAISEMRGIFLKDNYVLPGSNPPPIQYAVCESGALLYDLSKRKIMDRNTFSPEELGEIIDVMDEEDMLVHVMSAGQAHLTPGDFDLLKRYHMNVYRPMYEKTVDMSRITKELVCDPGVQIEKINLYHARLEGRERTKQRLAGSKIMQAYSEYSSLELTPAGTTKGAGLTRLCEMLGISLEETIFVGDAENDRTGLEIAGLPIAMGNALPAIKEICKAQVADNNHDGCVEAIEKYLLKSVK